MATLNVGVEKRKVEYQTLMSGAHEKVFQEHKAGFDKAIRQVRYKFKISINADFDILQDVHEGTLMSINDISNKLPIYSSYSYQNRHDQHDLF